MTIRRGNSAAWRQLRLSVLERDGWQCAECGRYGQRLECDHILPVEKGGTDSPDNLQAL